VHALHEDLATKVALPQGRCSQRFPIQREPLPSSVSDADSGHAPEGGPACKTAACDTTLAGLAASNAASASAAEVPSSHSIHFTAAALRTESPEAATTVGTPPGRAPSSPMGTSTKGTLNFGALQLADHQTVQRFITSNPDLHMEEMPTDEIDVEQLEDVSTGDWGLEMLVKVGETWASSLLNMTQCALPPFLGYKERRDCSQSRASCSKPL
jgi:hypothetical protein